jgi:hypothetical protein
MAFGHAAIQVLTIRVPPSVTDHAMITTNVRAAPWRDSTVQIWPTQTSTIVWPPKSRLNGEVGLDLFAERFSTSGIDEKLLDELAI